MLEFTELARILDQAYSVGYADRDGAMRRFGTEHEPDLRQIMESRRTLSELAKAARIGDAGYWAGYIREGMGIAVHLRNV